MARNLGFDEGFDDGVPDGWTKLGEGSIEKQDGTLVLRSSSTFGIGQSIDPTPFRARGVRIRARLRTEGAVSSSGMMVAVVTGASVREAALPSLVGTTAVREIEVLTEVPADTTELRLTLLLSRGGALLVESLDVEPADVDGPVAGPARLDERGAANLAALARLLAYVRFFHPSDEAAAADWERIAVAGVRSVEGATDDRELAGLLGSLVRDVAPSVHVFAGEDRDANPITASGTQTVAWRHVGVRLTARSAPQYSSSRGSLDRADAGVANLYQLLRGDGWRGRRIRLVVDGRADGRASAWIRLDTSRGPEPLESVSSSLLAADWSHVVVERDVPSDQDLRVAVGFALEPGSRAEIRSVRMQIDDVDAADALVNPLFSGTPGGPPWGWSLRHAGLPLEATIRDGHVRLDHPSAAMPDPDHPLVVDLATGVRAILPVALRVGDLRDPEPLRAQLFTLEDRAVRLAGVALAWGVFQHFYPYFDVVDTDWSAALVDALSVSAAEPGDRGLRLLVAALHDGHGNVSGGPQPRFWLPFAWACVGDRVVVTASGIDNLRVGDVVEAIDGRKMRELLAERERFVSGGTVAWRRLEALRETRAREGVHDVTLLVERARQRREEKVAARTGPWVGEARPDPIAEVPPGIMYVDLMKVSESSFVERMPDLESASGIVFDCRGYPTGDALRTVLGRLIDEPVTCAQWHFPVTLWPDRREVRHQVSNWVVEPKLPRLHARSAFMTDARAISYAETFMGIVEHYRLGAIVGEPTAGTNGNVNPFTVPGGLQVSWTGMRVLKHDGSQHHGIGILPTHPVSRTIEGIAAGRDEVLERAIEVVRGEA